MRGKNPKIFLEDILKSIERIELYTKGKTKKEFLDNYEKQDAIIKRLRGYRGGGKKYSIRNKEKTPRNSMERHGWDEKCSYP